MLCPTYPIRLMYDFHPEILSIERTHVIGFSLGAHVSGAIGKRFKNEFNTSFPRITDSSCDHIRAVEIFAESGVPCNVQAAQFMIGFVAEACTRNSFIAFHSPENCGPSGGPTGTEDAPPLSGDAHVEAVPTATGQPCPEPGPEQAQPQECLEENYGPSGGPTGIEDAPPLPGDAPVETVPPATRQPYPEPDPEQAQPRECLEENCGPSGGPTGTEEAPPLHDDTGQPCPAGRMPRNPEEEPIHEEPTGKAANGGEMGGATEIGVDGVPWIVVCRWAGALRWIWRSRRRKIANATLQIPVVIISELWKYLLSRVSLATSRRPNS
ncbi:hypothetical protein GE061_014251 [Apolygus lucorum]|uniref:Lipase domain-containing protein n=1 Tax=Apolygus lucorum TaxID=248454 RepID=A0A8S9XQC5_APOLU|nr:hypothetical protein GE061_014251 [Apolygus lucorum]